MVDVMNNMMEIMEGMYELGYLNERGLDVYIKLLKGDLKDYSERTKEVIKEKGKHTD